MSTMLKAGVDGFRDSWILAGALVSACAGGAARTLYRLVKAYAAHRPLPIAPDKFRKTA